MIDLSKIENKDIGVCGGTIGSMANAKDVILCFYKDASEDNPGIPAVAMNLSDVLDFLKRNGLLNKIKANPL